MSEILEKIKSRGSWTVRIYPSEYKEDRIPLLGDLVKAVTTSAVELRGWDFPHIDKSFPERKQDYVEQQLDWQHYVEIWRAYKSGQFISISAIYGDWRDHSTLWPPTDEWKYGTTLSVEDSVFRLIEIFEFAARWAKAVPVGEEMVVENNIQGLQNRILKLDSRLARFSFDRNCSVADWKWKKSYPTSTLFSSPRDNAIEPSISLFELFGWDATKEKIRDIQMELERYSTH